MSDYSRGEFWERVGSGSGWWQMDVKLHVAPLSGGPYARSQYREWHRIYQCLGCKEWQIDWIHGNGVRTTTSMHEAMEVHELECGLPRLDRARPRVMAR